ncbi:MAG: GTPase HflX [Kiritimatiellae bacterium]|nr:GTPase HflX [Kiritimatiellia bacterium]
MRKAGRKIDTSPPERALLVQAILGWQNKDEAEDSLLELERLSDTAGAVVIGSITQRRERPTASFFVGEGKLADIQLACRQAKANMIVFDNDLSAVQVNNLDLALGIKVIDRTELILQIFARRARSAEAQIQVKLAQLQYLISRMPVSAKQHRFHGGIGMRGPGESPLHLRNEPMRRQIKELKKKLEKVQQRRRMSREGRLQPVVCIVGYTNAGKSTLLNAFAAANAYVDDRLFATLDTKTRLVHLPDNRNILMTDTVGFIRHLPHGLVASFRSTLEVAAEANLLLIVADAGHSRFADQLRVVKDTLGEIGAGNVPSLLLLNKCDTPLAKELLPGLMDAYPDAVPVSALQKEGLDKVKELVAERLRYVIHSGNTDRKS